MLSGGVGKLEAMKDSKADVIGLDWSTNMAEARDVLGPERVLQETWTPCTFSPARRRIRREVANSVASAE